MSITKDFITEYLDMIQIYDIRPVKQIINAYFRNKFSQLEAWICPLENYPWTFTLSPSGCRERGEDVALQFLSS